MSAHDEALVTELAELATDQDALYCGPGYGTCGWRSVDSDQAPGIITAILDRLVEKGWRPPATPAELQRGASISEPLCAARLSTGPDAWLLCVLHEGHAADHRSGDVTWMGAW